MEPNDDKAEGCSLGVNCLDALPTKAVCPSIPGRRHTARAHKHATPPKILRPTRRNTLHKCG